ncbi:hypothetical protein [Brevundimonas sp. Root1423]|uniref:hypothetical protein n=1 Tax=Brevundimonas sp. Root1423 TaxID=1736462 RepID=UPI0007006D48|nr:hypothetical protein [Brevundimonas sp. Root1423]KQY75303.1 hypothetical protein ASD25_12225 [Brevundimonas sp. Root1423]
MSQWLELLIAVPIASLVVLGLWKASNALTRRGVIVRPVSSMDASMTKIEKRFGGSRGRCSAGR